MASPISVTLPPRTPPAAVVALSGEHDAYSSERLENELGVLLGENRNVALDLRDTEFVDSTTLSVLLAGRRRAEESGLGFVLVLPTDDFSQVHQILELTGLASAFAIRPNVDDALEAACAGKTGSSVRSAA